eukprot:COSAG01_NODE_2106_length_8416_cov_47.839485_10_plen_66_part_00
MRSARDQPAPAPLRAPGEALSFPPMAPPKAMPSLDGGGASNHPPAGITHNRVLRRDCPQLTPCAN